MATIRRFIPEWKPSPAPGSPDSTAPRIERVKPPDRRTALALLLTGRADEHDPAVDQFLNFTRAQQLSLDDLWAHWWGDRLLASVLLVPAAGKTAMLFLNPAPGTASGVSTHGGTGAEDPRVPLLRAAVADRPSQQIRLIQCLLDPGQAREKRVLLAGGFNELATLLYLQRATDSPFRPLDVADLGLTVRQWSDKEQPRFAQTILESYRDTLDCPGLLGIRPIEDVIEGHHKTGIFHPDMWFALHHDDEPAAVLLVNEVAQHGAHELVYLGVAPAWRGRGLGRRLLRHALGLANRAGSAKMVLAVDEINKPAQRLYRDMGFGSTGRKLAMIFTRA